MAILITACTLIALILAVMTAFALAGRKPDPALPAMSPEGYHGIRVMPSEDDPGTWIASHDGRHSTLHDSPECALTCAISWRSRHGITR